MAQVWEQPPWGGVKRWGGWELLFIVSLDVHSSVNEVRIALAFETVMTLLIYAELAVK